jgi:hypothetical protein
MRSDDRSPLAEASDDPGDPAIERLVARLREPVSLSPGVERVVLERLRAEAASGAAQSEAAVPLVFRPRSRRWPALVGAVAAGLAAAFAGGVLFGRWSTRAPGDAAGVRPVEFALRTPADSAVALVGDFNDWNPGATPLRRASDGVWTVTVPLRPGRYRYTFIVDGTRWRRDPAAPRALEDDFGAPTSVITIAQR